MKMEKIKRTSTSTEMAVKALPKEEKTWEQIVPKHYHKWQKVFSEEEAKRFPQHQPWDIAIDLVKDAPKILDCKIYPLTLVEQGREIPTGGRLQEAKLIYSARLIPPSPYPGTSG